MLDQGRRLTPSQALVVGLDTARALDFAHRRGFVHRDVKPANLLFGDDGRLRIADFGLARALSEAAWTEPGNGLVGTARYAAPEQAGAGRVDGKADVYALGLVLIEAVSGSVPLVGESTLATLAGRADTPVPVPPALGPLVALLEKVGRPDPADRPDAAELGLALHAAARELDRPEPLPLAGAVDLTTVGGLSGADPTLLPPAHDVTSFDADATTAGVVGKSSAGNGATTTARPTPPSANGSPTTTMSGPPTAVFDSLEVFDEQAAGPVLFDDEGSGQGRRRRRRWPWLVLVTLLLAGVVAGAVTYVQAQPATAAVPQIGPIPQGQAETILAEAQTRAGFERPWQILFESDYNEGVPEGHVVRQEPPPRTILEEGGTVTLYVSLGRAFTPVPNLEGLSQEEAEAALVDVELVLGEVGSANSETVEAGVVLDWSADDVERPEELRHGSEVDLVVSAGPAPRTVPSVAGKTEDQAVAELEAEGLRSDVVSRFDDDVEEGLVIGTDPGGGASVERGETITVVVSKGPDLVTVPDVVGKTLDELNRILEDAGLRSGDVSGKANGSPAASDPEAGARVERGTAVDIFLKGR